MTCLMKHACSSLYNMALETFPQLLWKLSDILPQVVMKLKDPSWSSSAFGNGWQEIWLELSRIWIWLDLDMVIWIWTSSSEFGYGLLVITSNQETCMKHYHCYTESQFNKLCILQFIQDLDMAIQNLAMARSGNGHLELGMAGLEHADPDLYMSVYVYKSPKTLLKT